MKILCLSRSYQGYALRHNQLAKIQLPTKSCALYCGPLLTQSRSEGFRNAIFINRYSSNSNSIGVSPNEHLSGIQKDRQRAAEMLSAASGGGTVPPTNPSPLKNAQSLMNDKLNSMYKYYDRFSHTDEIREAHEHVERLQEELIETQQKRRDVAKKMNDIRYEIQVCYGELASCQKGESRYLELVRKEYEVSANAIERLHSYAETLEGTICYFQIHHKEKQLVEEFNLLDKAERDLFIHLQAAVKTSHEKEKIHTNSAKYWSIVGSLLGN